MVSDHGNRFGGPERCRPRGACASAPGVASAMAPWKVVLKPESSWGPSLVEPLTGQDGVPPLQPTVVSMEKVF